MNDTKIDLDQTDEEILTDEVSDEALEAAGSDMMGRITFTFSINIFYCQFC